MFRWGQPQIGHQLTWTVETLEVADLGHDRHRNDEAHTTHRLAKLAEGPVAPLTNAAITTAPEEAQHLISIATHLGTRLRPDDAVLPAMQASVEALAHARIDPIRIAQVEAWLAAYQQHRDPQWLNAVRVMFGEAGQVCSFARRIKTSPQQSIGGSSNLNSDTQAGMTAHKHGSFQMICDDQPKLDIRKMWLQGYKALRFDGVTIRITTTKCHYGGERRWFQCPGCDRRCAVLYKPDFRCRICRNGRYWVERFSPLNRRLLKSKRLRESLGQYRPNLTLPIPGKPPRMHWRTYNRICAEIRDLEARIIRQIWGPEPIPPDLSSDI